MSAGLPFHIGPLSWYIPLTRKRYWTHPGCLVHHSRPDLAERCAERMARARLASEYRVTAETGDDYDARIREEDYDARIAEQERVIARLRSERDHLVRAEADRIVGQLTELHQMFQAATRAGTLPGRSTSTVRQPSSGRP